MLMMNSESHAFIGRIRYLDYLSEVPSHLDLMDIKWMKQEDCILHRQEDMMPEQAVS